MTITALSVGEVGRLLCHRFTTGFFLPNVVERDEGEKIGPSKNYPWQGVRNPHLTQEQVGEVVEGVY